MSSCVLYVVTIYTTYLPKKKKHYMHVSYAIYCVKENIYTSLLLAFDLLKKLICIKYFYLFILYQKEWIGGHVTDYQKEFYVLISP